MVKLSECKTIDEIIAECRAFAGGGGRAGGDEGTGDEAAAGLPGA